MSDLNRPGERPQTDTLPPGADRFWGQFSQTRAGRTRTQKDLAEYQGKRASAGRMAPRGFPRDNRFT